MSLEAFLSYRPPSYYKILHPPSVDLEWNVTDARDLMNYVLHILTMIEKDVRYEKLYDFLEKKETYISLYKELDDLYDKIMNHRVKESIYEGLESSDVSQGTQTLSHYYNYLLHADFLVARDHKWRKIFLYNDY